MGAGFQRDRGGIAGASRVSLVNLEFKLAGREVKFAMSVDSDSAVDKELLFALRVSGCPETEVCDLMARAATPGSYVIDGGANIGFFTVLLSKLVGPEGYVLAIEPGSNNLCKLEENIKVNKCANVEVVRQPLWNKPGMVKLYMCEDGSKNSLSPHAGTRGAQTMETAVLDDYPAIDTGRVLRLIKLDIEGVEELALRGGETLLTGDAKCPYIVMELNHEALPKFGSSCGQLCDFMREHGYEPFLLHFNGALPTYLPRRTKVVPSRMNWNVLFSTFEMVGAAWPEIAV